MICLYSLTWTCHISISTLNTLFYLLLYIYIILRACSFLFCLKNQLFLMRYITLLNTLVYSIYLRIHLRMKVKILIYLIKLLLIHLACLLIMMLSYLPLYIRNTLSLIYLRPYVLLRINLLWLSIIQGSNNNILDIIIYW